MTVLTTREQATTDVVFDLQLVLLLSLLGLALSMALPPLLGADVATLMAYAG